MAGPLHGNGGQERRQPVGTCSEMSQNQTPLLIKRYASRRLYNTETSDYVTLQEISDQIRSGRDVKIVDLKTGDDLTRQYLIQIIADLESRGEHVLPQNILVEVVRAYNDQAREMVPRFLDASFEILKENQSKALENLKAFTNPLSSYEEIGRSQKALLANMLNGWSAEPEPRRREGADVSKDRMEAELDDLKRMVEELQSKVANM